MSAPSLFFRTPLILFLMIWLCSGSINAQDFAEQTQQLVQGKQLRIDAGTRLSARLHVIVAHFQLENGLPLTAVVSAAELAANFDEKMFLDPISQKVGIRIQAEQAAQLLAELEKIGFVLTGNAPSFRILEGYLDPAYILSLEGLAPYGLISATAFANPVNNTGSVGSQADTTLQSYRVRGTAPDNFDGSGVNVGVLSDSYDFLGGAAAGITSGDLPAAVNVLQDNGSSDEGRAMIEIIHDMAPGAGLFFATANGGEINYANNIQALATAGCGVIVDDVVYLEEPFYQDGILSQTIEQITTINDAIYFSSAGNRNTQAYENTTPTFSVDPISGLTGLDFDQTAGIDYYQQFTLEDGEQFRATLQWDDPWYSAIGVDTDLDILITDDPPTTILAIANDDNIATQIPSELISYTDATVDGLPATYNVFISKFVGPDPGRLKYVNFGTHNLNEFDTNSPTINPHAGAAACVAVAAAPYFDATAEAFTSHGPSTFLFDAAGIALASPDVRPKPDLTSSDAANNTFFGADFEGDGFPNFFGTSAAAPHAAGVAAILRQAFPTANRDAIYTALINSATDIDIVGTDSITGVGIIDAYRAIYPNPIPANLDVTDGFETANFSRAWELNYPDAGRMRPNTAFSPAGGTNHLTMDSWFGSNTFFTLNEAILHFDATGASNLMLSFDQVEYGDEDDLMPNTFTGSVNADGVALSVDGINWYRLFDLTGANSTAAYTNKSINLSNFATINALPLGADVQIKFQQYDNFPFPSDGMAFDNISITGTVLPVNLLSFTASSAPNETVALEWETVQEVENDHFLIERSRDGIQFEILQKVLGAGTTDQAQSYRSWDKNPYQGQNYYRLWQVDRNGQKTLSESVSVLVEKGNSLSVFPNPIAQGSLRWQYEALEAGVLKVRVLDLNGGILQDYSQSVDFGLNQFQIELSALASGTYLLEVSDNKVYRSVKRFSKL
ncbi:MAG: T9SS type A sorting domain-containing protein [Bacteroidia bacterium]